VSFQEAVTTVLTQKYVDFSGRARRSEYWWFYLFSVIVYIVTGVIDRAIGSTIIGFLVGLALLLPGLGVAVRRLHDTGRSGWWLLIALTIIGIVVLIVFLVTEGEPGANSYGPSPKGEPGWGPGGNQGADPNWGQS
jgi:uncharacterized membrane protein YhaH (DUF805 family)